jgi:hypothetical protein
LAVRTPIAALSSASNWIFTFRKCPRNETIVSPVSLADRRFCAYSRRAHHSGIDRKHRVEDIRLLRRIQRVLRSCDLLLL